MEKALITHKILTMTMILHNDRILLLNRPDHKGFPGYIAPGGKVDYPESIVDGAIREVYEETGLIVKDMAYKGLAEHCDTSQNLRYMVFNYLATSLEGELLENPPEGELRWVHLKELDSVPMQDWFKARIPLFLEPGTFEHSVVWDSKTKEKANEMMRKYE